AAAGPRLPLDQAGRWTVGADGRVVVLHGVNMVSKRPPYAPDAVGFGDDDAAFLAAEGYDTVRLGVIYAAVEPQPGVYDDGYLDRIAATVRTLGRHGIVSLLDFHQDLYNERFQGEGWPDWAISDDGLPAEPQLGFPGNYLAQPALNRAFDHFWANDPPPSGGPGLQDRYAAAWRHVALRFRDDPDVQGYDLLNEPWPGTGWQACAQTEGCPEFDARLSAFTARVTKAIRTVDPTTLVYAEPHVLFNNGVKSGLADFGDHGGLSFHDYCLQHDSAGSTAGCDPFDDLVFANAEARAKANHDTLLLTEFGATPDPAVLGPMTARADRTMVGWQVWHYCGCADPTTTGAGDAQALVKDPAKAPAGNNLDAGKLSLLSRPYPRVVAGTPLRWSFDPAGGDFSATWSPARAGGGPAFGTRAVTEIALVARQYPDGFTASVSGGRVRGDSSAGVLRVSSCPGAPQVTVTVKRGAGAPSSECRAPALRMAVSPRVVPSGRRVTLRIRVRVRQDGALRPVRDARVRVAGVRTRTDARGIARVPVRFAHRGVRQVVAAHSDYRGARRPLTVAD
ncbi:MAG: endoglycosylceramidase, partial [Solirubrobacteraceae bacterium]|nr:endoglycosylceramidase [Solirubrobacteraceae bacterium]